MDSLLVVTSLPDRESAEKLAVALIERRLAACVNILAPCTSVYRWKGEIQRDEEHPLLIKTVHDRYADLEALIRANHPYELPEIIAVRLDGGLPAYLQWVESETHDNDERA
jgi:periplasmic divalent cation tolerance protein